MTVRAVLQTRLDSTRLPAKAMLTLAGHPAFVLAARRAMNRSVDLRIATSIESSDDAIAAVARAAKLACTRGPLDDVLARFVLATQDLADDDVVVRLTADNVFPDGALIDLVARAVLDGAPYASLNAERDRLPYGLSVEAFRASTLARHMRRQPTRRIASTSHPPFADASALARHSMNCPRPATRRFAARSTRTRTTSVCLPASTLLRAIPCKRPGERWSQDLRPQSRRRPAPAGHP